MVKKSRCGIFSNKSSQISVFIIIGILIIIIAGFIFVLTRGDEQITPEDQFLILEDKSSIIRNNIETCLSNELKSAMEFISLQGGYVYKPQLGLERQNYNIAYNYYLGVNLLPSFDEIQTEEISPYIKENLPKCLQEFDIQQYVSYDEIDITTNIEDDYVQVNLVSPIILSVLDQKKTFNDFSVKQETNLGILLDTSYDIIEHIKQDPNWIDIGYLESLDLEVEVIHIDDKTIVYKINDPYIDDFYFMFSALFTDNSPPDLFTFSDYSIRLADTLELKSYALDFDNDDLKYSSSSPQIDINSATGLITFKPASKGEFNFDIKVEDQNGMFDIESLKVVVI
tara:strand:- start:5 stop:1024 length:1020 start_codon:yes stop_codon:yes gene_type:complete